MSSYSYLPSMSYSIVSPGVLSTSEVDPKSSYSVNPAPNWAYEPFSQPLPAGPPLFEFEQSFDSSGAWENYYDYKVDKTIAYHELKPGCVGIAELPLRRAIEPMDMVKGRRTHVCKVSGCKARPFTRHRDLYRHFYRLHGGGGTDLYCDYKKCPHHDPLRRDHAREHYREYHLEDLIKRGQISKGEEYLQGFLGRRTKTIQPFWWRCTRCLVRVTTRTHGYRCFQCYKNCEPERVAMRKRIIEKRDDTDGGGKRVSLSYSSNDCRE